MKALLKGAISDHKEKKISTISQNLTELLQFLSLANFSFLVSGNQLTTNPKLNMAIAQSFLKIQSSSFLQTSPFFMWKRILHQNWGVIGSHVWSFLVGDRLWRAKLGVPPQKISNFFPEIFCQWIDRKSQEVSSTYVKPFGFDRR